MITWDLPQLEPFRLAETPPPVLPYVELALDPVTNDLAIPPAWITGPDAVIQRVQVRFRFFLGEWFLDQRLGVPYFRDVLIKNPDPLVVSTVFRKVLEMTPGVSSVDSLVANLDASSRTLMIDFKATLSDGSVIVAQAEPFILS
jgi:hypothetical protein